MDTTVAVVIIVSLCLIILVLCILRCVDKKNNKKTTRKRKTKVKPEERSDSGSMLGKAVSSDLVPLIDAPHHSLTNAKSMGSVVFVTESGSPTSPKPPKLYSAGSSGETRSLLSATQRTEANVSTTSISQAKSVLNDEILKKSKSAAELSFSMSNTMFNASEYESYSEYNQYSETSGLV